MKQFIKVTVLTKGFFDDIEHEDDIIIGLNQVSEIYEDTVAIGNNIFLKLTPESMESLKEYIEYEDCTGKKDKSWVSVKYPDDLTFVFDGVTAVTNEIIEQMRTKSEEGQNE